MGSKNFRQAFAHIAQDTHAGLVRILPGFPRILSDILIGSAVVRLPIEVEQDGTGEFCCDFLLPVLPELQRPEHSFVGDVGEFVQECSGVVGG